MSAPPAAATVRTESAPVASVTDLRVTFRRHGRNIHALRGVTLDIAPGEIVGLVGESGSGKSVLAMSLLGLLPGHPVLAGAVSVNGQDMRSANPKLLRSVRRLDLGAVFQDPMTSLNPTMRVGEQVAEAAGTMTEAVRLLTAVGIPDAGRRAASYPHELSGGLRQRVMIAMAIAGDPSLIIADEPTTALDVTVQAQVLTLLRELSDQLGCSVLLVTHDLGVAAQIADRVAVMYAGRLVEVGPTHEVLTRAAHPYTLALLRSRLSLTTDRTHPLLALHGEVLDPVAEPRGCSFRPRCVAAVEDCAITFPEHRKVILGHSRACIRPAAAAREKVAAQQDLSTATLASALVCESAPTTPQLKITDLTRTFVIRHGFRHTARLRALRSVSMEVGAGESVALVGESGSGKSTLLRIIAGLETYDSGAVQFDSPQPPQMVFQDAGASLTPWLTVGEIIGERLRGHGLSRRERDQRVRDALMLVGLPPEAAKSRSGQMSGGQRQRVSLARATVVPPSLLLCDEPTSALDVSLAASVINLIADLRARLGMTVLFVTHDLAVARIVAERIAVMYLGRIVEIGTAEEITSDPVHPYTKSLLGSIPDEGRSPTLLRGEPASPLHPPTGCAFHPRCPLAIDACADATLEVTLQPHREGRRQAACIREGAV